MSDIVDYEEYDNYPYEFVVRRLSGESCLQVKRNMGLKDSDFNERGQKEIAKEKVIDKEFPKGARTK